MKRLEIVVGPLLVKCVGGRVMQWPKRSPFSSLGLADNHLSFGFRDCLEVTKMFGLFEIKIKLAVP